MSQKQHNSQDNSTTGVIPTDRITDAIRFAQTQKAPIFGVYLLDTIIFKCEYPIYSGKDKNSLVKQAKQHAKASFIAEIADGKLQTACMIQIMHNGKCNGILLLRKPISVETMRNAGFTPVAVKDTSDNPDKKLKQTKKKKETA